MSNLNKNTAALLTLLETVNNLPSIEDIKPDLQEKHIIPTKDVQVVTADEDYDGLSKITVNPIPDEYIIPTGTLDITENGEHDVASYANINVNVTSSGGNDFNIEENSYDVTIRLTDEMLDICRDNYYAITVICMGKNKNDSNDPYLGLHKLYGNDFANNDGVFEFWIPYDYPFVYISCNNIISEYSPYIDSAEGWLWSLDYDAELYAGIRYGRLSSEADESGDPSAGNSIVIEIGLY